MTVLLVFITLVFGSNAVFLYSHDQFFVAVLNGGLAFFAGYLLIRRVLTRART